MTKVRKGKRRREKLFLGGERGIHFLKNQFSCPPKNGKNIFFAFKEGLFAPPQEVAFPPSRILSLRFFRVRRFPHD